MPEKVTRGVDGADRAIAWFEGEYRPLAEAKVGIKMNIAEKNLPKLLQSLPALRNPTIANLSLPGWVAVETIIDEAVVRELIPQLKAAGAEGIIEYPLNKVVY